MRALMTFLLKPSWVRDFSALAVLLIMGLLLMRPPQQAEAAELPRGVLSLLSTLDARVTVRFDGLITFSNGERYVPVLPSNTELDATRLVSQDPVNAGSPLKPPFPDIMAFDNGLYLLRLVSQPGGRLTLPERTTYPFELKAGLLPQDMVLPAGLNIPPELTVILGILEPPPALAATTLSETKLASSGLTPAQSVLAATALIPQRALLLLDLESQTLLSLNPETGVARWKLGLGCLPSSVAADPHLAAIYVTCLNTDELLVIDPKAQLIKARVPVGSRPDSVVWIPPEWALKSQQTVAPVVDSLSEAGASSLRSDSRTPLWMRWRSKKRAQELAQTVAPDLSQMTSDPAFEASQNDVSSTASLNKTGAAQLLVSNRFGKTLTVIDTESLEPVAHVPLPKGSGATAMTLVPELHRLMIADQALGKIYELPLETWRIKRILPGLQSTSGMVWRASPVEPEGILWMASRASHEIQAVSVATGKILQTLPVGQKPSDLAFGEDGQLYVLASQAGLIEVVDVVSEAGALLKAPIVLGADQFASRMTVASDKRYAYVGLFPKEEEDPPASVASPNSKRLPHSGQLAVIDFTTGQVLQRLTLPVQKPTAMLWIQPTP